MKWLRILVVLAVSGCGSAVGGSDQSMESPLISVHVASEDERPGYDPVDVDGRVLFAAAGPVVSDGDIVSVHVTRGQEAVVLGLEVSPAGAERLRKATTENLGEPLVLMFDSEVVGAPIIRSEISGARVQMAVPAHSLGDAELIVDRVRAHWPAE